VGAGSNAAPPPPRSDRSDQSTCARNRRPTHQEILLSGDPERIRHAPSTQYVVCRTASGAKNPYCPLQYPHGQRFVCAGFAAPANLAEGLHEVLLACDCRGTRARQTQLIADLGEAVGGPLRLTDDSVLAQRLLDLVPSVPTLVWGRDEVHAGEMWNSNSIVAWLIVSAGLDGAQARLPARGRAPGWQAGIVLASRAEQFA